jgi:hypothetical protein
MEAKTFKFEKEKNNKWYIVLPEWQGDKEELEMVAGADKLLDILSNQTNSVDVKFGAEPFDGCNTLTHESNGNYFNDAEHGPNKIWLCHVTKFVFGDYPDNIYYSKN